MYRFRLKDDQGAESVMQGSDLRAVLTVWHMLHGTEIVQAERLSDE